MRTHKNIHLTYIKVNRQLRNKTQIYFLSLLAGSSIFGQTAAKPQVTGLGGVDPKTSAVTSGKGC